MTEEKEQKKPVKKAKEKDKIDISINENSNDAMFGDEEFEDYENEELKNLYEESFKNISEGEVVKGTILQITQNEVLVDVGYKSEGAIPLIEFQSQLEEGNIKVGDKLDVYLEKTEDSNGLIVLSKEKADKIKIWDQIQNAFENEEILTGKVIERIKGGLNVDIGVKAFLPGSQIDLRPVRDPQNLIGQTLEMKVIKLNKRRGNIVLSRRAILENQRKEQKSKTMEILQDGAIVSGVVKNITEYGAFIDLGGIDGLLHITDMSWGRVNHPSELFMIGDKIDVVVLKFDREKERVSLGYKQKTRDPWETVDERYPIGSKVRGKVISITDYGAFVELEEGVEGLVHVSEMSWSRRIRNHSKLVAIGDTVEAIVLSMDKDSKRISLGMKQVEPNPWMIIEEKYSVGSEVEGRVRNLTNFGAFIELDEGIDGLVHISDMSWTKRINHPSEILKKGERIKAVILDIDARNERLSLGIKQLTPDPWDLILEKYPVGSVVKGKIVRISEFGAFVELDDGIEGLVHVSELAKKHVNNPEDVVKIDEIHSMIVLKIDPEERKIGLSIKAYSEALGQNEIEDYLTIHDHEAVPAKMGDLLKKEDIVAATETAEEKMAEKKAEIIVKEKKVKTPIDKPKPPEDKIEVKEVKDTSIAKPKTEQEPPKETTVEPETKPATSKPLDETAPKKKKAKSEAKTTSENETLNSEKKTASIKNSSNSNVKTKLSKLADVDSMISKIKHSIKSPKNNDTDA